MDTTIKRLDLGGTACFEDPDAVCISLDGSTSDDEIVQVVVGDYNVAPFASSIFSEAFGSCYLEEPGNLEELWRVMKPGSKVTLTGCEDFTLEDLDDLFELVTRITKEAYEAGFDRVVVEHREHYEETYSSKWFISTPLFHLFKEGESNEHE